MIGIYRYIDYRYNWIFVFFEILRCSFAKNMSTMPITTVVAYNIQRLLLLIFLFNFSHSRQCDNTWNCESDNHGRPKWHTHLCSSLASPQHTRSTRSPYIMYISNKKEKREKKLKLKHNKSIVVADFRTRISPEGISEKKIKHILASLLCIYTYYTDSLLSKVQAIVHRRYVNQIFEKFREFLEHHYNISDVLLKMIKKLHFICEFLIISY